MPQNLQSIAVQAGTFFLTLLCALALRTTVAQAFTIPSGSATPTLLTGDTILVSKFAYGYTNMSLPFGAALPRFRIPLGAPRRGDMAVFTNPHNGEVTIKRIVGLPGDRIQVVRGILAINGVPCRRIRTGTYVEWDWDGAAARSIAVERYAYRETLPNGLTHRILGAPVTQPEDSLAADDTGTYTVPRNQYFGMGDSRDNSLDSRFAELGPIPAANLIGRAELRLISMRPGAHLWQVWSWPTSFRFSRFLGLVV